MTEAAMKKEYNTLLQRLATPGLLTAGTNDNDESKQNDGNGPAFPLNVESDEEPKQPRTDLQVASSHAPKQLAFGVCTYVWKEQNIQLLVLSFL
jgi:hypothetical protein